MSDESEEFEEPGADAVARRSLILAAVTGRCFVEEWPPAEAENFRSGTLRWLADCNLGSSLTSWEQMLLGTEMGGLREQDRINGTWLSEGLLVLAWALGVCDLPPADTQCDPAEVASRLGLHQPPEKTVLSNPKLLPAGDLHAYNGFILDVHWRIRDFKQFGRRQYDFAGHRQPCDRFGLQLVNGDVAVHGIQLPDCADSERSHFESIVRERHRASNWLAGWDAEFHEVTTDT